MRTTTTSRLPRIFGRISAIWAEMDYAQRRMFEIQTGVSAPPRKVKRDR